MKDTLNQYADFYVILSEILQEVLPGMLQVILSYLPYALVTTYTPGPNNVMCLYSVSNAGWSKGLSVISGIGTGYLSVVIVCSLFCSTLAEYMPELVMYLKYFGAVYILWLAVHIAASGADSSKGRELTFMNGVMLAVSNIKMILYTVTVYTAYIIPHGTGFFTLFFHGMVMFLLAVSSWILWGGMGGLLQKFLSRYYRPFNITMGIILAWCAWQILK